MKNKIVYQANKLLVQMKDEFIELNGSSATDSTSNIFYQAKIGIVLYEGGNGRWWLSDSDICVVLRSFSPEKCLNCVYWNRIFSIEAENAMLNTAYILFLA